MKFLVLYKTLLAMVSSRARILGFALVAAAQLGIAAMVSNAVLADRTGAAVLMVDQFGMNLVVPIAALVFGTASLGDPIEDGTYVYLWLRPIRRVSITAAAFASTLSMVIPLAVVPTVAGALIIDGTFKMCIGAAVAALAGAIAYSALFVLLGQMTQRSLIWGIAYLLIFEQFISRGGAGLGLLTVHAHVSSLFGRILDRDIGRLDYFQMRTSVIALVVMTLIALWASAVRQNHLDVA
jgi:ABC-2 type transport system permease protein